MRKGKKFRNTKTERGHTLGNYCPPPVASLLLQKTDERFILLGFKAKAAAAHKKNSNPTLQAAGR